MEPDEWARKMRDEIAATVVRTGEMRLGAVLLVTRNPLTGAMLTEYAPVPMVTLGCDEDRQALADACCEMIYKLDAVAMIIFTKLQKDGHDYIFITYERLGAPTATQWFAHMCGGQVDEFAEVTSELSFFSRPSGVLN